MIAPPPPRTADEWARENRIMPPTAPIPGKFNPDFNPYMKPIVAAFAKHYYNRISFVMSTQMGKSVSMENIVGWRLNDDPTPILYVAPTSNLIDTTIEPKFMDMFKESACLSKKYDWAKSTKYTKWVGGTKFRFAWAGSPSELAADSAGLVLVDEVDRIVNTGEGDTTEVIEARGDAYVDSKIGYTATPTKGKVERFDHPVTGLSHWAEAPEGKLNSPIWNLWQSGTKHEWAVPCPHCHEYFIPHSELLTWPGKGSENECSPSIAEKEAQLACPNNGCLIDDRFRASMNASGRYVAPGESVTQKGEIVGEADTAGNSHASFWVSGLCSFAAKKSYGFLAKKLLIAIRSDKPSKLQAVYNTGFGECYGEFGEAPPWEAVKAMGDKYHSGEVLGTPKMILATVDVQKNRLVYVVRAWYLGMGSALIECGELWGDTSQADVWEELEELYDRTWEGHEIDEIGIDCGYRDDQVFDFVRRFKGGARALRGGKLDKPYRSIRVDVNSKGKVRRRGDVRWEFDSSRGKTWVHSRIGWSKKKSGFWVLPADVNDDYCKQIVGESFDESSSTWERSGDNHYLDCEVMQYMLARMKGLKNRKGEALLENLDRSYVEVIDQPENDEQPPQIVPNDPETPKESDWLSDYNTENWL